MSTQNQTIDWATELPLHREWMVQLARCRLGDPHGSEDIVQDVILSVVRQDPQLDDLDKIRSWLYRAVVRRVADHLRLRYRQMRMVDEISAREAEPPNDDGWDWMLAQEQRQFLAAAIQSLSEQDRELVLLKFTRNWSYRQLGERFGLADRAVEYRLVRVKQTLRSELRKLSGYEYE